MQINQKGSVMKSSPSAPGDMREELRGDAQKVADAASDRLHSEADSRKAGAADQAKSISSALDKVAGELGDDAPTWLKTAMGQGAQSLGRLAEAVDAQDSRALIGNVKQFAKANPAAFLAGCAALGFAAARVFRAGDGDATGSGIQSPDRSPSRAGETGARTTDAPTAGAGAVAEGATDRPAVPLAAQDTARAPLFQG